MATEQQIATSKSTELRWKLAALLKDDCSHSITAPASSPAAALAVHEAVQRADVIISHIEVNEKHGVGVLIQKIFGDQPNVISIRSQNHFNGEQHFGKTSFCLTHAGHSRPQAYLSVIEALHSQDVKRVMCIPYYADDVRSALAVTDSFGVPLCTYIMDDHNIHSDGIPDDLMAELLAKSLLRLAISPELRAVYESKYGHEFWLLPPVVSGDLLLTEPAPTVDTADGNLRAAIIGNVWGARWLELLRKTVRGSKISVDWYCGTALHWHDCTKEDLAAEGIYVRGGLPESELAPLLRKYAFVILPSGTLDNEDDRRAIARLSLPSKVPFILGTSNTPIIVLGSPQTAASRFIHHFKIGTTAEYSTPSLLRAANEIAAPATQFAMRQNAARMTPVFSSEGISDWIWNSLELRRPYDQRFEALMGKQVYDRAEGWLSG